MAGHGTGSDRPSGMKMIPERHRAPSPVMITSMDHDESRDAVFGRLLRFLNRLGEANAFYRLDHTRPESIMVEIMLPGWHWEVEFMADGAVEIERYQSVSGVEDRPELLEEFLAGLEGSVQDPV
jgi:hypothetical protein